MFRSLMRALAGDAEPRTLSLTIELALAGAISVLGIAIAGLGGKLVGDALADLMSDEEPDDATK